MRLTQKPLINQIFSVARATQNVIDRKGNRDREMTHFKIKLIKNEPN